VANGQARLNAANDFSRLEPVLKLFAFGFLLPTALSEFFRYGWFFAGRRN
jgi:hypothetical protein